jgi:hypothetical protein
MVWRCHFLSPNLVFLIFATSERAASFVGWFGPQSECTICWQEVCEAQLFSKRKKAGRGTDVEMEAMMGTWSETKRVLDDREELGTIGPS